MVPFVQMMVIAAIVGFFVGKTTKASGNDPLVFNLCVLIAGMILAYVIYLLIGKSDAFDEYGVTSGVVAIAVAVYVMHFDNDEWRKRFKKKTSQALEKLVAKVKELAPTPPVKPMPIPA
jgi:hypothetical protein